MGLRGPGVPEGKSDEQRAVENFLGAMSMARAKIISNASFDPNVNLLCVARFIVIASTNAEFVDALKLDQKTLFETMFKLAAAITKLYMPNPTVETENSVSAVFLQVAELLASERAKDLKLTVVRAIRNEGDAP